MARYTCGGRCSRVKEEELKLAGSRKIRAEVLTFLLPAPSTTATDVSRTATDARQPASRQRGLYGSEESTEESSTEESSEESTEDSEHPEDSEDSED